MLELYVYTINLAGNRIAALSLVPPEQVTQAGLPTEAILGDVDPAQKEMTIDNFTPNERFVLFLTKIVETHAATLPDVVAQAEKVKNGPVYVIDYRSVNSGEKPPFEDVIGWFGARNGEIVPDSYSANPNYQLLTNAGPPQLDPTLETALLTAIREIQAGERVESYPTDADDAWWNQ